MRLSWLSQPERLPTHGMNKSGALFTLFEEHDKNVACEAVFAISAEVRVAVKESLYLQWSLLC